MDVRRRFLTICSTALLCAICSTATLARATEKESVASFLLSVDTSNGVTREEADKIAKAYFLKNIGCGAYKGISETPNNWIVEGLIGFAGEPIKGFLINKLSGSIQSPVGPSYSHPNDLLQE